MFSKSIDMNKMILAAAAMSLTMGFVVSCQSNHAGEPVSTKEVKSKKSDDPVNAPVRKDEEAIGQIETNDYVMKLHRAFTYTPEKSEVLANWQPKPGFRFIYLDVSLRNKSSQPIDGGFIFIALKVKGRDNGVEYKKPAAALAGYASDNPQEQNQKEYNALWESFEPNEFHREIVYAVEVPNDVKTFTLSLPVDKFRKEWKELEFSI